jgi:hypothetical protein
MQRFFILVIIPVILADFPTLLVYHTLTYFKLHDFGVGMFTGGAYVLSADIIRALLNEIFKPCNT